MTFAHDTKCHLPAHLILRYCRGMAGMTIEYARQQLANWQERYDKSSGIQAWSHQNRSVTHYSLDEILKQLRYWSDMVQKLESGRTGGPRVRGVVFS